MHQKSLLNFTFRRPWLPVLALVAASSTARAQWVTESYNLKPGWNAVWLPMDVTHEGIATLAHPDIQELWRWNAVEAGAFTDTPAGPPSQTELQWSVWRRTSPEGTTLNELTGNDAYLVKVADSVAPFAWAVKGKPLVPRFEWNSNGLNFVGFPTQTPPGAAKPTFERFFGFDSVLGGLPFASSVLYYNGGPLSDVVPRNPRPLSAFTAPMERFGAYWVDSDAYTSYYGPFKVELSLSDGLNFGSSRLSVSMRLTNAIAANRNQTVTVTLAPAASEAPPGGTLADITAVPLLVRGSLNLATGVHDYAGFTGPITRVLAPGETSEVIFTVNRAALGNTPGAVFQSLVRLTDSLNQVKINLPVRAETTSRAGLWGGVAMINTVERVKMERSGNDSDTEPPAGAPEPEIDPETGRAIVTRSTTKTAENTARAFPLKLLVHSDAAGNLRLLQQAYTGEELGVASVATTQTAFSDLKKVAGRTSSSHFPLGMKRTGMGMLGLSGSASFMVPLAHNDGTNPFVHAYHPDHDNLDARFENLLAPGRESPAVQRNITLTFSTPPAFNPAWGASQLGGTYTETITGLRAQPIVSSGTFLLQRMDSGEVFLNP